MLARFCQKTLSSTFKIGYLFAVEAKNEREIPKVIPNLFIGRNEVPRRFRDRQKKREKILSHEDRQIFYNPLQALRLIRLHSFTSFPESIDFCIRLNVNPKNGEQIVRGTVTMPAGTGKSVRVAVLCSTDEYEELLKKGAKPDLRLTEEMIKDMEQGKIKFERLFTTPQHLTKIRHLGKVLGPKGLMPNAKVGTLVTNENLFNSLIEAKQGQVTFRVDTGKNIHALLGRVSFSDEEIMMNLHALMKGLVEKRPPTTKGKYFLEAYMKSTMSPRWRIELTDIDPRNPKSIWSLLEKEEAERLKKEKF